MSAVENRKLIENWYEALAAGDWETIADMHVDDVVYNMVGTTPVSGPGRQGRVHRRDDRPETPG